MPIIKSRAKLIEGFQIVVDDEKTHSLILDLPKETGTDLGPTALTLSVMSFAGCIATIFILMAKKRRVEIKDLEINMEAEKPDDSNMIKKVDFILTVTTDANEKEIDHLIRLTKEHCPVGQLFLHADVEVDYKVKIERL